MEIDYGTNNLKNVEQVENVISTVEQIDSGIDNAVEIPVIKEVAVGNVTTEQLESNQSASVDIAKRVENNTEYLDFDFGIPKGETGPYFTPTVDDEGNLSWTNNGGLSNPNTVNIKGPQGPQGEQGPQGPAGEGGTVDSELSETSENAVQNKVITNALNEKLGNNGEQILNGTLKVTTETVDEPSVTVDKSVTVNNSGNNTSKTTTNIAQINTNGLAIGQVEETTTSSGSDTVTKEIQYGLSDIKVNGSSIIRFTDGDVTINGNLTSLSTEATPVNYIAVSKQYTIEGTSATQDINVNSKISPSIIDLSVEGTLTNASGTTITANAVRIDPSSMRISGKPFSFSIKSSADDSYSRAALISTNGVFNFYETPTVSMDDGTSEGLMSESQVIRTDAAQTLTASEKQQAQTNMTHTATQDHATSGVQVGWYQVANLKTNGNYDVKIKQSYNYNLPEAIHLSISINSRLFTSEPFASITQISGVKPGTFALSKIRVRQGTDEGTTFLDVYNPDQLWNTTWVDITSDSQDVVVETNSPFQFIGTEDNPSGYKISSLDLVTGMNTNGVFNFAYTPTVNSAPVFVATTPSWVRGTSGSLTLPGAGWYILYGNYSYTGIVWWSPQDPNGEQVTTGYIALNNNITISTSGVVSLLNAPSGVAVYYYKIG